MSVLVYLENRNEQFTKSSFELLSYAAEVSSNTNQELVCITCGKIEPQEFEKLSSYGAKKILHVENAPALFDNEVYSNILFQAANQVKANIIILSDNNSGKALAPRLAIKFKAGLISGIIGLPTSFDPLVGRKRVFSGKAFAQIKITSPTKVLTLAPNSYQIVEAPSVVDAEVFNPKVDEASVKLLETNRQEGKLLLSEADIVVSGGRGMKSADNWAPLEELANLMGAATACSRPVSDEGWRPHHEHVGQTGKMIAPTLYIALGISGAIQHIAGVSSSKVIVAVNKDPEAAIFSAADYGVVGDVQKVIPAFIEAYKELKK